MSNYICMCKTIELFNNIPLISFDNLEVRVKYIIWLFYSSTTRGLLEGGSAGTSMRGPESQEEARESLKDPIALAHIFCLFIKIIM